MRHPTRVDPSGRQVFPRAKWETEAAPARAGSGDLIHYERSNAAGPKAYIYLKTLIDGPDDVEQVLTAALGTRGVVHKQRRLFRIGTTRLHPDEVEGLGSFLELEVVLDRGQTSSEGEATTLALMEKIGIADEDLVEAAYSDLLENRSRTAPLNPHR